MIDRHFRRTGRGWRIALGAVLLAGAGACNADKLTRLNTDPNNPTSAPPQPVFTYAVRIAMQRWFGSNPTNMRGPVLTAQHLAQVQYPDEDQYLRLNGTVTDASFVNAYSQELKNFQAVIDAGKADGQPLLWGPAQVMRSLVFGYITDVWGDVPYSQALQGDAAEAVLQPKYDAQKDIYTGLFNDLSAAVTAMAGPAAATSTLQGVGGPIRSMAATALGGGSSPTRCARVTRCDWQTSTRRLRERSSPPPLQLPEV